MKCRLLSSKYLFELKFKEVWSKRLYAFRSLIEKYWWKEQLFQNEFSVDSEICILVGSHLFWLKALAVLAFKKNLEESLEMLQARLRNTWE